MKYTLRYKISIIALFVFCIPFLSHAKSVQWGAQLPYALYYTDYLETSITYTATIQNLTTGQSISDGAAVTVGDQLQIQTSLNNSDIVWYPRDPDGLGMVPYGSMEPRNGFFLANASKPAVTCDSSTIAFLDAGGGICIGNAFYGSGGGNGGGFCSSGTPYYNYAPVSVNPPTITYSNSGTAGVTCNASGRCTVNSAGSLTLQVNYSATYGKNSSYSGQYGCLAQYADDDFLANGPALQFNVSAQTISFNLTATPPNQPPVAPTVTGSCAAGNSGAFTFTSTDPEGQQLYYEADWDNNGTADGRYPGAGLVNSGTAQAASYNFPSSGTKTIKARAVDSAGNTSVWSSEFSVTCAPPPPTVDLKANNSNGPITVNAGAPFTLTWSTTNTSSCTKNGTNWGSMTAAALNNSTGDSVTINTAGTYSYSLSCNGVTDYIDVTVQGPPSGQCTVSPSSIITGNSATWSTSNVTGGNGSYTYSWSGTDSLSGNGNSVAKSYSTAGTKSASVAITSAGQTTNVSCTNTLTVNDPTATITASSCTIPTGASSCTSSVSWSSSNTTNPLSVRQNGTEFSTGASSAGTSRTIPYGNTTFTFHHSGGTQLATASASASCTSGTAWDGSKCLGTPAIPANLTATPGTCGTNYTDLSWNVVADTAGYDIQIDGGAWFNVGNVTTYRHGSLTAPGTVHTYRVRAWNVAGAGNQSTAVTGTEPSPCAAGSCGSAISSGPYTSQPGTNLCSVGTVAWQDTTGVADGSYNWSCTDVGGTANCAANFKPQPPNGLSATSGSCGSNTLSLDWNDVTGATSYSVYYSNGTWVANTGGSNLATFTGSPATTYTFYVRANSAIGEQSNNSVTFSGTTASACSAPTVTLSARTNSGAWSSVDRTVNTTDIVDLQWISTSATTCTATAGPGFVTGGVTTGIDNVTPPTAAAANTYTVSCTGPGGTTVDSIVLTPRAPTVDLRVDGVDGPLSVSVNSSVTLSWTTSYSPTSCTASVSWSGAKSTVGSSESVNVGATAKTYTITCANAGGSVTDSVSVSIAATPPSQPTTTVGACTINDPSTSVTMQGSDPQGQTLRYEVDWNNDGTPDQLFPGVWFVAQNTLQSTTHIFTAASNPFQVRSVTSDGRVSAWKSETASCLPPIIKSMDLKVNNSNGPLSVLTGAPLTVTWTSVNGPTNCTKWGSGWGSGNAIPNQNPGGDTFTVPAGGDTYAIFCDGGVSDQVVVSVIPLPTATLQVSINGGAYSTADTTIDPTDTVSLRWSSTNSTACSATAGPGFAASGIVGTDSVSAPAPNSTDTYAVNCTGPGGSSTDTITITTRQRPNFSLPNITYALPSTFNAATGYYDWIDVTFNTQNNGGSDTKASANYQFSFDRNRDGFEYTTTGSLGLLTVGQTVTRTERVTGNIPFGNARIDVTVDNTNAVAETDEGDNTRTYDLTIPPPDPGLSLTADKIRLRQGETTTIRWTIANPYAGLTCTTYGPNTASQNATLPSGTRTTAAIEAQSVYTLECTESLTNTKFTKMVTVEVEGKIEEV